VRPSAGPPPSVRARRGTSLQAEGEPLLWLTGGALALGLAMIVGLLALILWQGFGTFWPGPLTAFETHDGTAILGQVVRSERFEPGQQAFSGMAPQRLERVQELLAAAGGAARRHLVRTGNFDLTGEHFQWVSDYDVVRESRPEWAVLVERLAWGVFIGHPRAFLVDGAAVASDPAEVMARCQDWIGPVAERRARRQQVERHKFSRANRAVEEARLGLRRVELESGLDSPRFAAARERAERATMTAEQIYREARSEIEELDRENARYALVLAAANGAEKRIPLAEIVRAYPANRLSLAGKARVYLSRWGEFLTAEPREANSEGGVYPALFGTVVMTLIMCLFVVPFGVMAALYLREYARKGLIVSVVRVAINNLAGVPSIVFGVFGLGFFCYIVGSSIDSAFYRASLPNPTFGKGGLLWASLTLALLTLPVVIVATEEALAAVPGSMREGSYACGASKWQTIRRIVLPRAMPGIVTGMILAVARGAGEVAPLMLVGAVKLAPELPVDGIAPFLHPERSFMHLGFHIYDLGFQSPNSEAAKPMVFTTTFLLIMIVAVLNISATWLRSRFRRAHRGGQF